jgi:hypothetical protein
MGGLGRSRRTDIDDDVDGAINEDRQDEGGRDDDEREIDRYWAGSSGRGGMPFSYDEGSRYPCVVANVDRGVSG